MSSRVFKNYQVNLGNPFQITAPAVSFDTIKMVNAFDFEEAEPIEEDKADLTDDESSEEIIAKAREEADFIIKEAHFEASRIIENTEKEANENKLRIEEAARQKGYEDGTAEAVSQYDGLLQEVLQMRDQAQLEYAKILQGVEADAINVILDIARKVIGAELSTNKEDILHLVKQGFEKCSNREKIILKVSACEYEFIQENKDRLLAMVEGIGELEIKSDSALKAGACIIETPYGSIDAGAQTKLDKIEEAFKQLCLK